MALITCPECGKEISDTAKACPNCGFLLEQNQKLKIRRTPLSKRKSQIILGVVSILFGLLTFYAAFFWADGPIIAALLSMGGLFFVYGGYYVLPGVQKGICPYCNNEVKVACRARTCKCPHCHKISNKKDGQLETMD